MSLTKPGALLPSMKALAAGTVLLLGVWPNALGGQQELVLPTFGAGPILEDGEVVSLQAQIGVRFEKEVGEGWWGGVRAGGRALGAVCDYDEGGCPTSAWEVVVGTRRDLRWGKVVLYLGAEAGVGRFPPAYTLLGFRLGTDLGRSRVLRMEMRVERLMGPDFWAVPLDLGFRIPLGGRGASG